MNIGQTHADGHKVSGEVFLEKRTGSEAETWVVFNWRSHMRTMYEDSKVEEPREKT